MSAPNPPRPVTPTTILAQQLRRLVQRLDDGGEADASWQSTLRQVCELAAGLDPYLDRWTTPESPALTALAERTRAEDWAGHDSVGRSGGLEQEMLSGHVEGQLLKMLVHATRATRVLEIGMFTGYSALAMAEALPADGRLIACEIDPDVAEFAGRCFEQAPSGSKIDVRVGPASVTLAQLAGTGEVFDLIFIDADKGGYWSYLDAVLNAALLAPHGLICVDNTLMQGQPWTTGEPTVNGTAIAEFNRMVAADPRVEQVIIPLRDGLSVIRTVDVGP